MRAFIDEFAHRHFGLRPTALAGLDARDFVVGSVPAYEPTVDLVPIRRKGKPS